MHTGELGTWLEDLEEGEEVRVHAGTTKLSLSSVGALPMAPRADLAERVKALVVGAELGPKFRIWVHGPKGKVLRTGYFTDQEEGEGINALAAGGPVHTAEDALWRVSVTLEAALRSAMTSNERVVAAFAAPLEALKNLFQSAQERLERTEEAHLELTKEHHELEVLGRQALDTLAAKEAGGGKDSLREAAAEFLRALLGGGPPLPDEGKPPA
jgi:hypothetical protein